MKDFEVYPVLKTGDKAWIEYETKDLVVVISLQAEAGREGRCLGDIDIFEA